MEIEFWIPVMVNYWHRYMKHNIADLGEGDRVLYQYLAVINGLFLTKFELV